jgi:hypothetical protein
MPISTEEQEASFVHVHGRGIPNCANSNGLGVVGGNDRLARRSAGGTLRCGRGPAGRRFCVQRSPMGFALAKPVDVRLGDAFVSLSGTSGDCDGGAIGRASGSAMGGRRLRRMSNLHAHGACLWLGAGLALRNARRSAVPCYVGNVGMAHSDVAAWRRVASDGRGAV